MECLSGESLARVALHLDSRDRLSLALCSQKLYDCLDTSLGFQKTCNQIPSTLKLGPLREYGDDVHNGIVLSAISEDGSTLSIVSTYDYPEGGTRWLVEIVNIPQGKRHVLEFSTRGWLVEHMRCVNRLSNDGRILVIGGVVGQSRERIPEASLVFFLEVGDDSVKLVRGNLHMAWTEYFQCRITSSAEFVAVMGGSEDHYSINIFTADGSRLCWWPVRYSSGSCIAFTAEDELVYFGEMDDSDDESVEVRTEQEQPRLWIAIPPFGPNSGMTLLPPLPPNQGQRRAHMRLDVSGRIISFGRHLGLLEVFDVRKVAAGWAYERRFHCRCPDLAFIELRCFQLSGDDERERICLYSTGLENGIQYWMSEEAALKVDWNNSDGPWIATYGSLAKLPGVRHGTDDLLFEDGSAWYSGLNCGDVVFMGKFLPFRNRGTRIKYTEFGRAVVFGDGDGRVD